MEDANPQPDNAPAVAPAAQAKAKPKRPRYTDGQIEIIKKAYLEEKLGHRAILKKKGNFGLTVQGVKEATERLKNNGSLGREESSGRKPTARTEANAEKSERLHGKLARRRAPATS